MWISPQTLCHLDNVIYVPAKCLLEGNPITQAGDSLVVDRNLVSPLPPLYLAHTTPTAKRTHLHKISRITLSFSLMLLFTTPSSSRGFNSKQLSASKSAHSLFVRERVCGALAAIPFVFRAFRLPPTTAHILRIARKAVRAVYRFSSWPRPLPPLSSSRAAAFCFHPTSPNFIHPLMSLYAFVD
jgi:hypothetical protein